MRLTEWHALEFRQTELQELAFPIESYDKAEIIRQGNRTLAKVGSGSISSVSQRVFEIV